MVLVELGEPLITEVLARDLQDQLSYQSPTISSVGAAGTAILSRPPGVPKSHIPVAKGILAFDQPSVIIKHPRFGPVRVAAVHPYAPIFGGGKMRKEILQSLDACQASRDGIPGVMAGDLNSTRAHPAFRELAQSFDDAGATAGLPHGPAVLAIDHILVKGLVPTGWRRVLMPGTDPYGIVTRVTSVQDGTN